MDFFGYWTDSFTKFVSYFVISLRKRGKQSLKYSFARTVECATNKTPFTSILGTFKRIGRYWLHVQQEKVTFPGLISFTAD